MAANYSESPSHNSNTNLEDFCKMFDHWQQVYSAMKQRRCFRYVVKQTIVKYIMIMYLLFLFKSFNLIIFKLQGEILSSLCNLLLKLFSLIIVYYFVSGFVLKLEICQI